jgi:hypothetical protein
MLFCSIVVLCFSVFGRGRKNWHYRKVTMHNNLRKAATIIMSGLVGLLTGYLVFRGAHWYIMRLFPDSVNLGVTVVSGFFAVLAGICAAFMASDIPAFLSRKRQDAKQVNDDIAFTKSIPPEMPRWPDQH